MYVIRYSVSRDSTAIPQERAGKDTPGRNWIHTRNSIATKPRMPQSSTTSSFNKHQTTDCTFNLLNYLVTTTTNDFQNVLQLPYTLRLLLKLSLKTAFLNDHFQSHWIGRRGPVSWPPRSPGLNSLDYYLWGYMKSLVYEQISRTRDELIDRIDCRCIHS